MAVRILNGPPLSAKSQILDEIAAPEDAVIDSTLLWTALFPYTALKVRSIEQARLVEDAKARAVMRARDNGMDAWVTIATPDRAKIQTWMRRTGAKEALTVIPPRANVERAARRRGRMDGSDECEQIVNRWYESYEPAPEDVLFDVREWGIDPGSDLGRYLTVEGAGMADTRAAGGGAAAFRLTADAALEVREAADGRGPVLAGTVLRYGDKSRITPTSDEVFRRGAIQWDSERPMNLNVQHDRARAIGLVSLQDAGDRVLFESEVLDTTDGRDAITAVKGGVLRGASLEFHALDSDWIDEDGRTTRVITRARMVGLAVVDDGAYPSGRVEARAAEFAGSLRRWRAERAARRALADLAAAAALEAVQ